MAEFVRDEVIFGVMECPECGHKVNSEVAHRDTTIFIARRCCACEWYQLQSVNVVAARRIWLEEEQEQGKRRHAQAG